MVTDQFLPEDSAIEMMTKIATAKMALPIVMLPKSLPAWELELHPCLQTQYLPDDPLKKLMG
jgi:hypothetical protein